MPAGYYDIVARKMEIMASTVGGHKFHDRKEEAVKMAIYPD